MVLELPADKEVHELLNSYVWLDEEGILWSREKDCYTDPNRSQITEEIDRILQITGGKVCMIVEPNTRSKVPAAADREFVNQQLERVVKALAIINHSLFQKLLADIFFHLVPPRYPTRMFTSSEEAVKWVRQFNLMSAPKK
jgi:GTPase